MKSRSIHLAVPALLLATVAPTTAFSLVQGVQQVIQYNVEYKCGGETIVVSHCRNDSDRPGLRPTPPAANYCQVYYPDRPNRNGPTKFAAPELYSDLVKKLQACGALAASQPQNQPAPPPSAPTANAQSAGGVQMATNEYKKGRAYLDGKDYSRAIEHFRKSNEIVPSSAAYNDLGIAYHKLKQYPEAIEAYKQVIRMVPNNAGVHLRLAIAYQDLGSSLTLGPSASKDMKPFETAETEAREAIRLKPDYQEAYFVLGTVVFVQSKYSEALAALQQAIRLKADDQPVLYSLGLTYAKLGRNEDAMQAYRKLATLDKEFAQKLLTEINKPAAATSVANAAPGTAESYLAEAYKYRDAKDYAKAIEASKKAIALKPSSDAHFTLGFVYYQLKQYQNALPAFQQALRLKPNDSSSHYWLGVTFYYIEQYPNALAALQDAVRLNPKDSYAHHWIGETYFNGFKQSDKAVAAYKESLRLNPGYARNHNQLGLALSDLRQSARALAAYREAVRLDPGEPLYLSNLGFAYLNLGQLANAEQVLRTVQKTDQKKAEELAKEILLYKIEQAANPAPTDQGGNPVPQPASGAGRRSRPDRAGLAVPTTPGTPSKPPESNAPASTDAEAYKTQGDNYFMAGHFAKATEPYKKAIALKPSLVDDLVDKYYTLGFVYDRQSQYQLALSAYKQGLALKPDHARLHIELGHQYFKLSRYGDAVAAYQEAIRLKPDLQYPPSLNLHLNAEAHLGLGISYVKMANKNGALQVYRALQRIDKAKAQELYAEINESK